jgi:hypothetical protein
MAAVLSACGSGSGAQPGDALTKFLGSWTGTAVGTVNGQQSDGGAALLYLYRKGTDGLTIGNVCADQLQSSGPPATLTGPNSFRIEPYVCPATPSGPCLTFSQNMTDGNGTLEGNTLSVTMNRTQTCDAGPIVTVSVDFTGTRQ